MGHIFLAHANFQSLASFLEQHISWSELLGTIITLLHGSVLGPWGSPLFCFFFFSLNHHSQFAWCLVVDNAYVNNDFSFWQICLILHRGKPTKHLHAVPGLWIPAGVKVHSSVFWGRFPHVSSSSLRILRDYPPSEPWKDPLPGVRVGTRPVPQGLDTSMRELEGSTFSLPNAIPGICSPLVNYRMVLSLTQLCVGSALWKR